MAKKGAPRREFNQNVADRICKLIIEGKSLKRICAMKRMPGIDTVMRWLTETQSFADQYARAREEQAEGYADQLVELSRKANAKNAHAIRVQVDVIKWVCSKLKPKKYGDRLGVDLQADITMQGRGGYAREQPLEQWTRNEQLEWGRERVFVGALTAKELETIWGFRDLSDEWARLLDKTWKRLLATAEGGSRPPAPPPARLPAPPPAPPKGEAPEEKEINPRKPDDEPPPFAPSHEEMGLE